jgi:hypothetical protein
MLKAAQNSIKYHKYSAYKQTQATAFTIIKYSTQFPYFKFSLLPPALQIRTGNVVLV